MILQGDPTKVLQGMTPAMLAGQGMPAIPQGAPMAPNPAPVPAPMPSAPPAFQPSNQAPPPMPGSQGEQEEAKSILGMIKANWEKDPEQAAFLLATGAALSLGKYMSPGEAISRSFMTGLAALGAVNKAHMDRVNAEKTMQMQQKRVDLDEQRVGQEGRRVDLASEGLDLNKKTEQRLTKQGEADIQIRQQQLNLARTKAQTEMELLRAQIANIPEDNKRQAATAVMTSASRQIESLFRADPLSGTSAVDGKSPEEINALIGGIVDRTRASFGSMGVQTGGTSTNEETIFRSSRADPANSHLTDEQLRAAIRRQMFPTAGAGGSTAPAAAGGGTPAAPSAGAPAPTSQKTAPQEQDLGSMEGVPKPKRGGFKTTVDEAITRRLPERAEEIGKEIRKLEAKAKRTEVEEARLGLLRSRKAELEGN